MILNKRHIKKVISEAREAFSFGAGITTCPVGMVKPGDIHYHHADYALPLPFLSQQRTTPERARFDTPQLLDTLVLIPHDELPGFFRQVCKVPGKPQLIHVGAILHQHIPQEKREVLFGKGRASTNGNEKKVALSGFMCRHVITIYNFFNCYLSWIKHQNKR